MLIPLLILITPQALADPQYCYSYGECYNTGHRNGYVGVCPLNACYYHTQAYYDGYLQGYRGSFSNNANSGFQQDESSQVNIHGNNNDVNINQAQEMGSILLRQVTEIRDSTSQLVSIQILTWSTVKFR